MEGQECRGLKLIGGSCRWRSEGKDVVCIREVKRRRMKWTRWDFGGSKEGLWNVRSVGDRS